MVRAQAGTRLPGEARDRLLADERRTYRTRPTGSCRPLGADPLNKRYYNLEAHRRLLVKLKGCSASSACQESPIPSRFVLDRRIPLAGVAHQCRTVRFGDDPSTSALDVNCKAHELDNLYVVDTSFFPSSSAVNPALTAMANSLRVGDHLERLGVSTTAEVAAHEPEGVLA